MPQEPPRNGPERTTDTEPIVAVTDEAKLERASAFVDASGRLVVPARFRRALGFRDHQRVIISLNGKGLQIQTAEAFVEAGIEYVQELARRYGTHKDGGVDALLAERRREAQKEREEEDRVARRN